MLLNMLLCQRRRYGDVIQTVGLVAVVCPKLRTSTTLLSFRPSY